jgi:hypothetical protein
LASRWVGHAGLAMTKDLDTHWGTYRRGSTEAKDFSIIIAHKTEIVPGSQTRLSTVLKETK